MYPATCLILSLLLPALAKAHMMLKSPVPINHPKNKFTTGGDYNYNSPLDRSGSNYPCKGYHSLINSPAGSPVASWGAGSTQSFTVEGTANHGGGSCQASISEDGGKSFKVVKSWIGNCPIAGTAFPFVVPKETKAGGAIFAWTWFNNLGNREMYMNCASVTITGSGGSGLGSYPDVFKANVGNGCSSVASRDLLFPNPGQDVSNSSPNAAPPVGNCGAKPSPSFSTAGGSTPVQSSAATTATTATTTPASPQSCMCICNAATGVAVTILPSPAVAKLAPNAAPGVFILSQPHAGNSTLAISPSTSTSTTSTTSPTPPGTITISSPAVYRYRH